MKIKTHIIFLAAFAMTVSGLQALPSSSGGNTGESDKKSSITNSNKNVDNKATDNSMANSVIKTKDASFKDSSVTNTNQKVGNASDKGSKSNSGINTDIVEITNAQLLLSSGIPVDNKALNDSKIKSGVEAEIAELKEAKLTSGNSNLKNNVIAGSKAKATGKKAEIGNSIIINKNSDVNNTSVKESTSNSGINLSGQQ